MADDEYKILGEIDGQTASSILGINQATSGEAIGVEGRTNSPTGFGLSTPDDAHVGGTLTTDSVDTPSISIGPGHETARPENGTAGIQRAHNDLPPEGGLIELTSGTYEVNNGAHYPNNAILIKKSNVALVGQGRSTVIHVPDNYTADGDGQKVINIGGNRTEGGNDQVSGYSSPTAVDGCLIANLRIDGNQQAQGMSASDDDGHNIEITGNENIVTNVWSVNATGDGAQLTSHTDPSQTRRCHIVNSVFRDCWEQAIHPRGCVHCVISNNICDGEVNNAVINLYSDISQTEGLVITNNHFLHGSMQGAKLYTSTPSKPAEDILFANNILKGNAKAGILIKSSSARHMLIRDNLVAQNNAGIVSRGGDHIEISGNTVKQNDIRGIWTQAGAPVRELYIERNRVLHNNRADDGSEGIFIAIDSNEVTDLIVRENRVIGGEGGINHGHGIRLYEINDNAGTYDTLDVRGNVIKGADTAAIASDPVPTVIRENIGYVTEAKGREVDAVPVGVDAATGDVPVTIEHGLAERPDLKDLTDVALAGGSTEDYAATIKEVRNPTATAFDVVVTVDSLSSSTGATVDVVWHVKTW